jgi:hypothetical protein
MRNGIAGANALITTYRDVRFRETAVQYRSVIRWTTVRLV